MLLTLLFTLSISMRDTAVPILLIKEEDKISPCKCDSSFDVKGVYFAFFLMRIVEGAGIYLVYFVLNKIGVKGTCMISVGLTALGQILLIDN